MIMKDDDGNNSIKDNERISSNEVQAKPHAQSLKQNLVYRIHKPSHHKFLSDTLWTPFKIIKPWVPYNTLGTV